MIKVTFGMASIAAIGACITVITLIKSELKDNKSIKSSAELVEYAKKECKDVPELDMGRMICVYGMVKHECDFNNIDVRLCGRMENKQ